MKSARNVRSYFWTALLLGFFILLLMDPEGVLESGRKAVELCLNIVLPSLLPFFVISRLILNTGAIHSISRLLEPVVKPLFNLPGAAAFPMIVGWFSGYPGGAKYTSDLYRDKLLTKTEAQRLLAFCNNSGPLFIVGAVGTGYYNSPQLGLILLLCHLLASITVGIGTGVISRVKAVPYPKKSIPPIRIQMKLTGKMLTDAISDSVTTLLQICGTILFFAVLVQALETSGVFSLPEKLLALVTRTDALYFETTRILMAGSLEITNGLYLLSLVSGIPMHYKILLTAFLCGFGGFSVHTQVAGLCPVEFRLKNYFYGKIVHGFIAAIYTGLMMINRSTPVMNSAPGFMDGNLINPLLLIYAVFLLFCIICILDRQVRHK